MARRVSSGLCWGRAPRSEQELVTVYAAVVALGSDLAAADLMSLEATNHLCSARVEYCAIRVAACQRVFWTSTSSAIVPPF
jgi:hypothetical protein